MKFRQILSILLAACCLISALAFSGCTLADKGTAMEINGVEISDDVFTYFLDKAVVNLGVNAPLKSLKEKATAYAETYFKTNSLAHSRGVTLTTAEKAAVSEKVNAYWGIYGEYYTKIGVTKETLTKVFTADSYREALLVHFYGAGGEEEIPLARLYAQFKTNYIVFQAITGYLTETNTNGQTIKINETDREALVLKFQNMSSMVNAGEQNMEQAADFLAESGYQASVQTVVLHKDDTSYPAGFFEKVKNTESRRATIIGSEEFIFLVLRGDADTNSTYFNEKRTEMIEIIVGNEIDEKIEKSLVTQTKIDNSLANGYYSLISKEKGDKNEFRN